MGGYGLVDGGAEDGDQEDHTGDVVAQRDPPSLAASHLVR